MLSFIKRISFYAQLYGSAEKYVLEKSSQMQFSTINI